MTRTPPSPSASTAAVFLQLHDRDFLSSSFAKGRLSNSLAFDSFVRNQASVRESKKKKKRRFISRGGGGGGGFVRNLQTNLCTPLLRSVKSMSGRWQLEWVIFSFRTFPHRSQTSFPESPHLDKWKRFILSGFWLELAKLPCGRKQCETHSPKSQFPNDLYPVYSQPNTICKARDCTKTTWTSRSLVSLSRLPGGRKGREVHEPPFHFSVLNKYFSLVLHWSSNRQGLRDQLLIKTAEANAQADVEY